MKEEPFSLLNDGSSDTGLKKMNVVAVNIFDVTRSKKVECKFYDMCVTTAEHSGKAENIFSAIDSTMRMMFLTGIIWSALVLTVQIQIWELGTLLSQEFCKQTQTRSWLVVAAI